MLVREKQLLLFDCTAWRLVDDSDIFF